MKYAYIRVSTVEQNAERQIVAMERHNIPKENYFMEKVSGKNTDRIELQKLLATVTAGDTIYIHDFSRLSRSTADLLSIVEKLNASGVHLVSNKENLDTSTPTGKLMLTMIGAINEFERTNLLERQKEGISVAKAKGIYKGRKAQDYKTPEFWQALADYKEKKLNKMQFADRIGVSRPTLDKILKEVA